MNVTKINTTHNKFNKYCELCDYGTQYASEWLKHVKSNKHKRGGLSKETKCDKCDYKTSEHWILKRHQISMHSILEERKMQKYYCVVCDYVFFTRKNLEKHTNGIHHITKANAIELK